MPKEKLGLYFGSENISIVELAGAQLKRSLRIPLPQDIKSQGLAPGASSAAISSEVRLVALLSEALRNHHIEAKKTFLGLSNREQFIRGFQMLLLTRLEMDAGVLFEVKKYIPFKTEDLVFDYQRRSLKKSSKMDILFVATTRNGLEASQAVLNQAGLKIASAEPAALALLRILASTRQFDPKLSFGLVAMQAREAEFTIVTQGFPSFSREINLLPGSEALESAEVNPEKVLISRLSSEVRVSLDFFRRQFSGASVDKILFLSKNTPLQEQLILNLSQDLGLPVERVELEKDKQADSLEDLDGLRAYALALKDAFKLNLGIDLAKKKAFRPVVIEEPIEKTKPSAFNFTISRIPKRTVTIVLVMLALAYGLPISRINQADSKLAQLRKDTQAALLPALKGLDTEALKNRRENYISKINIIEKLVNSRARITPYWEALPAALKPGLWLENLSISISEGRQSISLRGAVYLENEDAELEAAHAFHRKLKDNPDFMRGLKNLELRYITKGQVRVGSENYGVIYFDISGS